MKKNIGILYEDEAIVVVNKPSDFLTVPDRFHHHLPSLFQYLKEKNDDTFIVHRLDKETSGLVCFAKTKEAHRNLSMQFENRSVQKIYLALLTGVVANDSGIIDKPIAESMTRRGKMIIAKRGKPSVTHYKVLEFFKNFTLVEADIKTGRTHQIRVHFKEIGHPLAVDSLYGSQDAFLLSSIKRNKYNKNKHQEERPLMSRTSLHAHRLTLTHPVTNEEMTFESELPKDFAAVLKQLRKWGK